MRAPELVIVEPVSMKGPVRHVSLVGNAYVGMLQCSRLQGFGKAGGQDGPVPWGSGFFLF